MNPRVLWLGVLAFVLAMLVVLPVNWVAGLLPSSVQCAEWRGSVWRGQCRGFVVQAGAQPPLALEQLGWKLHPLALLRLRLRADVTITHAQGDATGLIEATSGGTLHLQGLAARALLDRRLLGMLPDGWRGALDIRDFEMRWRGQQLEQLAGEFRVNDLTDGRGGELGSYSLRFEPAAAPPFTGALQDEGGPLEVRAAVSLTAERSWTLEGTVMRRPDADPGMDRALDMLGSPDASGRRPLSAAGRFR